MAILPSGEVVSRGSSAPKTRIGTCGIGATTVRARSPLPHDHTAEWQMREHMRRSLWRPPHRSTESVGQRGGVRPARAWLASEMRFIYMAWPGAFAAFWARHE